MNQNAWSDDDRTEFDTLVTDALRWSKPGQRIDVFLAGLDSALEAGRYWAKDVHHDIRDNGTGKVLKDEADRRKPRVPVSDNGNILGTVPREMGTRRANSTGKLEQHRTLFDYLTWDELRAKRREFQAMGAALAVNEAAVAKLLELEELVPGASTSAEACDRLGTTVEDWLAG